MTSKFIPEWSPEENRETRRRRGRAIAKRKKVTDRELRLAARSPEEVRADKIQRSPRTRAWYAQVEAYAAGDVYLGQATRRKGTLKLLREGRWLELEGNLDDGESWTIVCDAADRNGYRPELGVEKFAKLLLDSRPWADERWLRGVRNSGCAKAVDISVVLPTWTTGRWQQAAEYAAGTGLSPTTLRFVYTLMAYARIGDTDEVELSTRVMCGPFGWKSETNARKYLARAVKAGIVEASGSPYLKGVKGGVSETTVVRFGLDRFTDEMPETKTVDLDAYTEMAQGFGSARKRRVKEIRDVRRRWRREHDTSAVDDEPDLESMSTEEQFKYFTKGVKRRSAE